MPLHPTTRIRSLGVAAYEIVTRAGLRILMDPFLDENPGSPVRSDSFDKVDLVIVSHAAYDHLCDTEQIAKRYGCPVIAGGEVRAYLAAKGVPTTQVRATVRGIRVKVAGIEVQPVECRHWSQIKMPDGTLASGVPMAFVVYADENVRFYHYGDNTVFTDMKLQAELYEPTIGCIGIANPQEILHRNPMPGEMMMGEMSPREGLLAAQCLGLHTVLPCHYCKADDNDVRAFMRLHGEARARGEKVPDALVLNPGDVIDVDPQGRVWAAKAA